MKVLKYIVLVFSWQTFEDLLRITYGYRYIEYEKGWISFVIVLAIEATTHLEGS